MIPKKFWVAYKTGTDSSRCWMRAGHFSIAMEKMVGESGKVIAVDIQEEMLQKSKKKLLIVEPKMHVSATAFEKTIDIARQAGLSPISEPKIRFSRSKLLSI